MRIAIVAGHGGTDEGAHYDGLREKVVNLGVSRFVVDYINAQTTHDAILIRDIDADMTLRERGQATREAGADLVVCIHTNAIDNVAEMRGRMAFYWPGNGDGKALAQRLTTGSLHTRPVWPVSANGWRSRAYNVIKQHQATAVLFEMGFASNDADRAYLLSGAGQMATAQIVCDALA